MLTAVNVQKIFDDCLYTENEDTSNAKMVEGIISNFGFHPERLQSHKIEIYEMLNELPKNFKENEGGGWSFLNACITKDGVQWGEHNNVEQLLVLGIATDLVKIRFPRSLWGCLPGGLPYFTINNCPAGAIKA